MQAHQQVMNTYAFTYAIIHACMHRYLRMYVRIRKRAYMHICLASPVFTYHIDYCLCILSIYSVMPTDACPCHVESRSFCMQPLRAVNRTLAFPLKSSRRTSMSCSQVWTKVDCNVLPQLPLHFQAALAKPPICESTNLKDGLRALFVFSASFHGPSWS